MALLFGVNLVFAATPLIKSTDGGRSWIDIDPGPPHQGIADLQVTPDGSRLYALTVTQFRPGPGAPQGGTVNRNEIAALETQIRAGHPDLPGLCLALVDWSAELRLLLREQRKKSRRS